MAPQTLHVVPGDETAERVADDVDLLRPGLLADPLDVGVEQSR